MSQSEKNLQDAFAGESQANRKYLAFSKKAEAEGFIHAAKLFRAAAAAETIHAHNHLRVLGLVKSTRENLMEAINGERMVPAHGTRDMPVWGPVFRSMAHGHADNAQLRITNLTSYIESLQQK